MVETTIRNAPAPAAPRRTNARHKAHAQADSPAVCTQQHHQGVQKSSLVSFSSGSRLAAPPERATKSGVQAGAFRLRVGAVYN